MLKNAFSYTAQKSKKWFGILLYIMVFQSAIMQVVGKLLIIGMNEQTVFLYQLIMAVLSAPLQLGVIKILQTLHEEHRFRPNELFYYYHIKRILGALFLGVLNAGFQSLFNLLGKYSGGITAGGMADGLTKMPMITGMLGAALTIFLFAANYSYVKNDTQKVTKVWINACKTGMANVLPIAATVFGGGFISYLFSQLIITFGTMGLAAIGLQGDTGSISVTILAVLTQGVILVFITVFQYGIARQLMGETREELLGIEDATIKQE